MLSRCCIGGASSAAGILRGPRGAPARRFSDLAVSTVCLGFTKLDSFKFATRPSKTCPLDQFSQLITNMVSDFAGDQYFCMIFTFNDRDPGFYNFKCRLPPMHFVKITFETALARNNNE